MLAVEGDKALVISRYGLDCKVFHAGGYKATWDTCTLREWLNSDFFNYAFSVDEQTKIQDTTVSADKNPEFDTNPGQSTTDKVFLLSISEARHYFPSKEKGQCVATEYAIANGTKTSRDKKYTEDGSPVCMWLLRTPGKGKSRVARTWVDGSINVEGVSLDADNGAVRPAMWIAQNP